ncbi:argininosuccinate lyase [Kitasatospora sp. NPDC036755]|uniref:argininosuccinate lyase n=1 Tax=Kitasatospora sp. NPDC036755 TaxID=3154600 RepID=UPI0033DA56DE
MTDTGRIRGTLRERTRQLVYGELDAAALRRELGPISEVDLAHLVMLRERDLIDPPGAARLLRLIGDLRAAEFAPLLGRPAPRGAYLMYEEYLVGELGEAAGRLHTGRSRNDLKATVTAIQLRGWTLEFLSEATRLEAVLLARARAHADVLMPVYTHFQAAMPITYGYYLSGIALALGRDVEAMLRALDGLSACPMGAGAVAGSDLPIDPVRVAALLGFERPAAHALDAVASRDTLLRLVGAAAGVAITLSRLATDLQLWSTAEFGFLHFPDRLVGGSSAMPQKRNAFLLEHVKAKAAHVQGAWSAAAAAIKSTPFTNTIEVGTEAVSAALPGLQAATDSVLFCQALVGGARPVPKRMARRAEEGFVTATIVANGLVRAGLPFRTAHQLVGDAVRRTVESGGSRLEGVRLPQGTPSGVAADVPLRQAAEALRHGGGPGELDAILDRALRDLAGRAEQCAGLRVRLRESARTRTEAVRHVMDEGTNG